MRGSAILIIALLLAGCAQVELYGGLGVHAEGWDAYPWRSPMGRLGIRAETEYTETYCEHTSSIPDRDGHGINLCGENLRIRLR